MRPLHVFLSSAASGAAALVGACNEPAIVRSELPVAYDYALDLPPAFVRQEVHGIDSKVEEFHSPDTVISTDFGHYSGAPSCAPANQSCSIRSEHIAGKEALVGLYRRGPEEAPGEPKPFRVFVHVEVDPPHGLALNLFARCDNEEACDRALGYFREVRLIQLPRQPASPVPAAPPPAPS